MKNCIFCKIIKGEIPSKKVYEDDDLLAFNDINPQAPVHILIVPKKHLKNLFSLRDINLLGKIQLKAIEISDELGISDNFKLLTNNGKKAGQEVMHIHYHLMGGYK